MKKPPPRLAGASAIYPAPKPSGEPSVSRQVLELLSRFLAPLRLPHKIYLVTMECERENASPFHSGELMKKVQARNWLAPPGAK